MKALTLSEFAIQLMETDLRPYIKHIGLEYNKQYPLLNIVDYAKFLNQEFKPEMITELFEGWRDTSDDVYNNSDGTIAFVFYPSSKCYKITYANKFSDDFKYPHTLSDFINDCQRVDIELQFREKE